VLGWLCICLYAAGWLAVIALPNNKYEPKGVPETIGFNFWFIIGFILLLNARREKRKMQRLNEQQVLDDFLINK
jgi:hypothetical protein